MVKASFFCEIAMVTRGFETRLQILPSKEVHIVRRDGSITSAILYGAGICRYFKFFISFDKILIRMEMSHLAVFPSFSSISLLPVLSYRR